MANVQQMTEVAAVVAPVQGRQKSLSTLKSDTEAQAARFHELVDWEFLGVLTPDEAEELAVLTRWQEAKRNAFYQEFADGVEQDSSYNTP